MKKLAVFIPLVIFLLTFLSLPTKVSAETKLNCTTTGVTGSVLDDSGKSVGVVGLGLTSSLGGNAKSGASNVDGSFSIGGLEGILTLSYNPYNDKDYERGNVILNQCEGILITVKKKEPIDSNARALCGKPCKKDSNDCAVTSDSCTYCGYQYNWALTESQSWHCTSPPAENLPVTAGENKVTQTKYEIPELAPQINKIVNYSTGIGGIIAFLLIVFGGFQIILSAGNPERVKAGKEMITSAIAGLLLIIFAVFILKLIGADILKIPEFTQLNK